MGVRSRKGIDFQQRKIEIMEQCFDCYAENGFTGTGIKQLAQQCGCTSANLYVYFENLDDLIVQSTEHCMTKVEDDFMVNAPRKLEELEAYIDQVPYWTAEHHGKKYRLMYQVYTHPKYIEYGKKFFEGVNRRYAEYAKSLEPKIGISCDVLTSFIFILIRACVHFALFGDEFYLQAQLRVLKQCIRLYLKEYSSEIGGASQ